MTFDIAILRAAQQGFFDIAVNFDDLFCSAKADCEYATNDPIKLLHATSGDRAQTLVMGLACTGGAGSDTHLYWQHVDITCGGQSYDLAAAMAASAPGNQGALGGLVFQHAYYFGSEQLGTYDKLFFDLAVGLDLDLLGVSGNTDCSLTATATVSDGALIGGQTPAGATWPIITWDIPINAGAATTLACTRHPLNGGNGLATAYTTLSSPEPMRFEVDNDAGAVTVTDLSPPGPPAAPIAGPYILPEVTIGRLEIFSTDTLRAVWSRDTAQQATPVAHIVLLDGAGDIIAAASAATSGISGTVTFNLCAGGAQTAAVGDIFTVGVIDDTDYDSDCAVMNASATLVAQQDMVVSGGAYAGSYVTLVSLAVTPGFNNRFNLAWTRDSTQSNFDGGPALHLAMVSPDGTAAAYGNTHIAGAGSGTIIEFYTCPGAFGTANVGQAYTVAGFDHFLYFPQGAYTAQDACDAVEAAPKLFNAGMIAQ